MPPLEPSDEERLQALPQDNESSFTAAMPSNVNDGRDNSDDGALNRTVLDATHPATDSNMQLEEIYEEGIPGAAEAEEPNRDNAVVDYHPENDERQQKG